MKIRTRSEAIERLNRLHHDCRPTFFLIDFLGENALVEPLENVDSSELMFQIGGLKNFKKQLPPNYPLWLEKTPEPFEVYKKRFDFVRENILFGNSFLLNLTCQTPIKTNWTLAEIFHASQARFKIWWRDRFVCFTPEPFVRITPSGLISSFPMKGTIDAALPNAAAAILADEKEAAEHATIVDLIRNDLSQVTKNVIVRKSRYLEKIIRNDGRELLQVSSEIRGRLVSTEKKMGEILFELLPAGSISGAPKVKTVELIRAAEGYERGFYTGIAGVFTGKSMEMTSCVLIRFIEKTGDGSLVFKSGGGITHASVAEREYEEMIQKIYVPTSF